MLKILAAAFLICCGLEAPAYGQVGQPIEIRVCPDRGLRPYPLDAGGRLQGLLVSGIAVINRGEPAVVIETVELKLLSGDRVLNTLSMDATEIERWAGNGPPVQGVMRSTGSEFCGQDLTPPEVVAGGPSLRRNQALLIVNQAFAFDRPRDALRVEVTGRRAGRTVTAASLVPIRSGFSRTRFAFPLRGAWWVSGASFHTDHRAHVFQEFGLDIARVGADGKTHRNGGRRFSDFLAYGAPVLAAASGRVIRAHDGAVENEAALQQEGEPDAAYAARHLAEASRGSAVGGATWLLGNHVMLDHGNGEYSVYAHLQPGSVGPKTGALVSMGDALGRLGSSGNSTEPHLHFHVCDRPDPLRCASIPTRFTNLDILWAETDRAIQAGDIVTAR